MANRFWCLPSFQLEHNVVRLYCRMVFGAQEVDQITFAAKASTVDGDYFVVNDWKGLSWAIALDTTGGASNTPTGAAWVAIPAGRKTYLDISAASTAATVSTAVHTALLALTGFTTNLTAVTSTTHQNITSTGAGVVTAPTVYSKTGAAGTGTITASVTTAGTANSIPSGNNKGFASSFVQNSAGVYTLSLGRTDPVTGLFYPDTYYKLLAINFNWDTIATPAAPLAPYVYLTDNSVATATKASFQITCDNTSQVATNPAATELLRLEVHLANSNNPS